MITIDLSNVGWKFWVAFSACVSFGASLGGGIAKFLGA